MEEAGTGQFDGEIARRLLLVDDDPLITRSVSRYLGAHGWAVDTEHNGLAGCKALEAEHYDVLLVDLCMPRMGGKALLEAVAQTADAPEVIVMSAFLDLNNTLEALALGAVEVLEKPVDPKRLIETIEQAAKRRKARFGTSTPSRSSVEELLGRSKKIEALRSTIRSIAPFDDLPALIVGETGTGKELVARSIHRHSGRRGEMLSINCASIPEELFESELFGHEAGAFTGARTARRGIFEAAANGTVFLDEVGEMPPSQQAKLLRVLETRTFRRVGSSHELPMRARVVSATNRPLRSSAAGECIRSDLFFRLAGCTLRTPPLRARKEDIEELAIHFLSEFSRGRSSCPVKLSPSVLPALHSYDWPGNVRELRGVIQNAAIRTEHPTLGIREVAEAMAEQGCVQAALEPSIEVEPPRRPRLAKSDSAPIAQIHDEASPLRSIEASMILQAYQRADGNISLAARSLGIPRTTLRDKLRRLGLR